MNAEASPAPYRNLRLFDDSPKSSIEAENDPCRLGQTAEALEALLVESLREGKSPSIGLFGGLGQGKSTILQTLERRLTGAIFRGRRCICHFFNAADHKPETLEFDFDRLVARWHYRKVASWATMWFFAAVMMGVVPLALLAWGLSTVTGWDFLRIFWIILSGMVSVIAGPIIAGGVVLMGLGGKIPSVAHWLRDTERRVNFGPLRLWQDLFPPRPSVLFIDNLDRASISQQRAVLRAIHKYRSDLNLPLVVAMDVEGLFLAKADPEGADELLRKVLDAVLHLPLRIAEDVPEIVVAMAREGAESNDNVFGMLLRDPRVVGDLTRVFSLLPGFGPRRVKRLLNDLMVAGMRLTIVRRDDIAAAIRILSMMTIAPALQKVGDDLLPILATNDCEGLSALIDAHCPDADKTTLARLFRATRHMQPADRHWRRILAAMPSSSRHEGMVCSLRLTGRVTEWASAVAAGRHGIHWPTQPSPGTMEKEIDPPDFRDPFPTAWPAFEAACCRAMEPSARLRLYQQFRASIPTFTRPDDRPDMAPEADILGEDDLRKLELAALDMLYRLWTADWEALEAMNKTGRDALLQGIWAAPSSDTVRLLLTVPGHYLTAKDRLTLLADDTVTKITDDRAAAAWLEVATSIDDASELSPDIPRLSLSNKRLLPFIWPGFKFEQQDIDDPSCRDEFLRHLSLIKDAVTMDLDVNINGFKEALFIRGWLARNCAYPARIAEAMREIFEIPCGDKVPHDSWSGNVFSALFLHNSTGAEAVIRCMANHAIEVADKDTWRLALLLACQYQHGDVVDLLLENLALLPNNVRCDAMLLRHLLRYDTLWEKGRANVDQILRLCGHLISRNSFELVGIHDRLRHRDDYGEMLSRTGALPPLPWNAFDEEGNPSELYLKHLAAIVAAGPEARNHTAALLAQYECGSDAVELRCRLDAEHLLDAAWLPELSVGHREVAPADGCNPDQKSP